MLQYFSSERGEKDHMTSGYFLPTHTHAQKKLFQTHYFPENLVVLGIKPEPLDL
jgi:hypothetical protein